MELFDGLLSGMVQIAVPQMLMYCFLGVFFGTAIGVLPGIGALAAISILLPVTFHIDPRGAIVMLSGIYYGTQYGGSTASILLNLPGSPSSAVTCLDGYPMAQKGRAAVALFMTTIASFVGSMIGLLALIFLSAQIARVGLSFGPMEYFSMMLLGLVAASSIAAGSALKSLAMVVLGLMLGTVGTDVETGVARFTMGLAGLSDGLSVVALAMGAFGISEIVESSRKKHTAGHGQDFRLGAMLPTLQELRDSVGPALRGSGIGGFFGALPGTGASIAAFMSYSVEKRISRHPERFGHGAMEGIVAPEAANNSAAQAAFIPTLSLGIPGDAVMALMLSAFIIHGVQPGPLFITENADFFWLLAVSFLVGNLFLVILNVPLVGLWIRLLRIPFNIIYPTILVLMSIGAYSVNSNVFDVFVLSLVGLLAHGLRWLGYSLAPMILGFVLGPLLEENLRRGLSLSGGAWEYLLSRPIALGLLTATAMMLIYNLKNLIITYPRKP